MSETISVTEFRAKCLDILGRVGRREVDRLIVSKHGNPVAMIVPPPAAAPQGKRLHGFLRGSVVVPPDADLTEPADGETFDAARGVLHR